MPTSVIFLAATHFCVSMQYALGMTRYRWRNCVNHTDYTPLIYFHEHL